MEYKYGMDGADNEAAPQDNHVRYIRGTGDYEMPIDTFGNTVVETREPSLGFLSIGAVIDGSATLSWEGGTGIRLQTRTDTIGSEWQDVAGTEDQTSATVTVGDATQQFFRLIGP